MAEGSGEVTLGAELAAAEEAERRHVPPGPSPIAGVTYPEGAGDLWRWSALPEDAAVAGFLRRYVAAGAAEQRTMRACLGTDDLYTVLLFAQRRALEALRAGDPALVAEVFDAASAVDADRVDERDVAVAAMLGVYAASRLGADAAGAAAGAIARADPAIGELIDEIVTELAAEEFDLAEEAGYRAVRTANGLVLVNDDLEAYEPDRDLVALGLDVLAVIEADGSYRPDGVTVARDLPAYWVGGTTNRAVADAIEGLTGCVSVSGERSGGHDLIVLVAEAATPGAAATIAGAAARVERSGGATLGLSAGRWCAVVSATSRIQGEPPVETAATLARFRPAIAILLATP